MKIAEHDEFQKFFSYGTLIHAKGEVVENPQDGRRLKIKWEPQLLNKLWYYDTFTRNLIYISDRNWARTSFLEFLMDDKPQDM